MAAFTKMVQELNLQPGTVELETLSVDDLDMDKFEGEEAIMALAVLDGDVLKS